MFQIKSLPGVQVVTNRTQHTNVPQQNCCVHQVSGSHIKLCLNPII